MDLIANPATLGGVIAGVALMAWALGRLQATPLGHGDLSPAGPQVSAAALDGQPAIVLPRAMPEHRITSPCQDQARAERQRALEHAHSLCDLHDEVSAFRRNEKVLATLAPDALILRSAHINADRACPFMGVIGHPTCSFPSAGCQSGGCAQDCQAASHAVAHSPASAARLSEGDNYPSAALSVFSRV